MPKHELSPDDYQYYHNKGQEDAAAGKWDSPTSGVASIITRDVDYARAEAYEDGRKNHEQQKNG